MAPSILKKRKHDSIIKPKSQRPIKKFKKQTHYSSSSSSASADEEASDFPDIDLVDSASELDADDIDINEGVIDDSDVGNGPSAHNPPHSKSRSASSAADSNSDSEGSSSFASLSHSDPNGDKTQRKTSKRNDPTAFSSAISSILSSKLPSSSRTDPVLARSSSAHAANTALRESALEKRARQQLRPEKKALLEKGRVKDVLLGTAVGSEEAAEGEGGIEEAGKAEKVREEEKRLKKTAQRGVVKLFNAVRMAQVRGEEARKEALGKGMVGAKRREERVGEMSKKGFLELVAAGGGKGKGGTGKMGGGGIEET